jgi:3-deoxy-manno-octulosonate cytidylyltransferase (CMP-KDO synthetase)
VSTAFRVVVPARFASTRLPGKPLLMLAGRPLIAHVCERALQAGAREVCVATDDARIATAVQAQGVDAVMTSPAHASGTDRIAEVARVRGWAADDIIINLQGDEPLVPPELLGRLAGALAAHAEAGIATVAVGIHEPDELFNPNIVKVVLDARGFALYFSRAPIPWFRGIYRHGETCATCPDNPRPLRHLGMYGYRVHTLARLSAAPPAALELAESLEQLRALELGIRIHVSVVEQAPPAGVDTPEDLARVEGIMAGLGCA